MDSCAAVRRTGDTNLQSVSVDSLLTEANMVVDVMDLFIGVLGPLEARLNGVPVSLGGPKQRTVLALLVASLGELVSTGSLPHAPTPRLPTNDTSPRHV
jgi:hypothetical protein